MSQNLVEVKTCQVCGSDNHQTLFEEPPYRVQRCQECSLVFVTPRWDDASIGQVYDADYWQSDSPKTKGYADYASEAHLYLKTYRRRMGLVREQVPPGGKVLDVGCAAGYFLRVMRDAGYETYGVELSSAIAQHAIDELGADRIFVGTLAEAAGAPGFAANSFDLITFWDVIEHVPDPQALLRQAASMLKPDGALIIETQNVDSRFASLLGRRWHHFKHEEHIYHFSPSTMPRLLAQGGFRVAKMTSDYGGKYVSLGFIAERAARLGPLIGLLLKPLYLLRKANLYLNLRDEIVVVAKPTG